MIINSNQLYVIIIVFSIYIFICSFTVSFFFLLFHYEIKIVLLFRIKRNRFYFLLSVLFCFFLSRLFFTILVLITFRFRLVIIISIMYGKKIVVALCLNINTLVHSLYLMRFGGSICSGRFSLDRRDSEARIPRSFLRSLAPAFFSTPEFRRNRASVQPKTDDLWLTTFIQF